MINSEIVDKIVVSYLRQGQDMESKEETGRKPVTILAKEFNMTPSKIRKILITAGVFKNEESERVLSLYKSGKTIDEIMKITGLGRSSVNSYLPYSKGIYKDNENEVSIGNVRIRKHRAKQINTVKSMRIDSQDLQKHIVFYSINDLGIVYHLDAVKEFLLERGQVNSLREAILAYNCYLYIEHKVFGRNWTEKELKTITDNSDYYKNEVAKYLGSNPNSILDEFLDLDHDYQDCTIRMAAFFNVYKKWSRNKLNSCLSDALVRSILKVEKVVKYFGIEITEYLCRNISFATEMLVIENSIPLVEVSSSICFPKELSNNKKATILEKYIDSENPDIGHLLNIVNMPSEIKINGKAKAKAERIIDDYREANLKNLDIDAQKRELVMGVRFVPYEEWRSNRIQNKSSEFIMDYPVEVIDQHFDPAGVLYCLKNMFGLFDIQNIQIMPSKRNHRLSIVDDFFCLKTKCGYNLQHHQQIAMQYIQLTLLAYYEHLRNHGILLEKVLGDDFSRIMYEKYGIENFKFELSTTDSSFKEKCVSIGPKIEGLFNRLYLITKNQPIDRYNLKGCPEVKFSLIDSFLPDKYLYVTDHEKTRRIVSNASALLFSNQSLFTVDRLLDQSDRMVNNFEMFLLNNISKDEIHDWDKSAVDYLLEIGCLIEVKKCLKLSKTVLPLKELWDNGCISTYKTPSEIRILRSLVSSGWLIREKTLLSRPEQDFMSYLYGNSKYPDAIALRNAYLHDDVIDVSEDMHKLNYMWFLFMIIVMEVKILDEFDVISSIRESQPK